MAYFTIPHRPTFGAPVFRSAYSASRNARASAAFAASIEAHCAVCRKTLMLQVRCAHPTGVFAPEHPFGMFRCCAWLIKIREHTVLSYLKRSCSRFAALTLRLRTVTPLRDIPVFRSAYFTQRVHSTLCSKTLDLQVRCAHPTGTGELRIPSPPFPAGAGTSEKEMRRKTEGRSAEKLLK